MAESTVNPCHCIKTKQVILKESIDSSSHVENEMLSSEVPEETEKETVGDSVIQFQDESLLNIPEDAHILPQPKFRGRAMSLSYDWDNVLSPSDIAHKIRKMSRSQSESAENYFRHHAGYVQIERTSHTFVTGSTYTGQWNYLGMAGFGNFEFPHKVEYEGNLSDGMFHGEGTLSYPMGQKLDGEWSNGKLISFKFRFADGLEYDIPWSYCQMPDRRYFTCIQESMRPAGRSLLTNNHPPREIPKGCYDTGDGFYNPITKCVWSAIKPNKIIRVPTAADEKWIMENCRKAWDEPTEYRPDLYEHWMSGRKKDFAFSESNKDRSTSNSSGSSEDVDINMIVPPTYNVSPTASYDSWWDTNSFKLSVHADA